MITNNAELAVAAKLRKNLLELVADTKDAPSSLSWASDASPNWLTANRIKNLLENLECALYSLGAVRVFIHSPCGSPDHITSCPNLYGHEGYWYYEILFHSPEKILVDDGAIYMNGERFETDFDDALSFQFTSNRSCPCNIKMLDSEHTVVPYFVWPDTNMSRVASLAQFASKIRWVLRESRSKKTRSGIREKLLQIVIELDEVILEETVESLLERRQIQLD